MHSSCSVVVEVGGGPSRKKSLIKHVMDNHASCAQVLRDAFLVTLHFVTRNALPT